MRDSVVLSKTEKESLHLNHDKDVYFLLAGDGGPVFLMALLDLTDWKLWFKTNQVMEDEMLTSITMHLQMYNNETTWKSFSKEMGSLSWMQEFSPQCSDVFQMNMWTDWLNFPIM